MPSVLNGCCGNINSHAPYEPDLVLNSERMGNELAILAERIILSMSFDNSQDSAVVDYMYTEVPMSYGEIPEELRKKVVDMIENGPVLREENGDFNYEWSMAASTYSTLCIQKREPKFMYPVQVFHVGGLAIVALAGEPFTDTQLEIKLQSKAPMTYLTHCANKYVGYMPPERSFAYNAHETHYNITYWAKLAPGSIEMARDAALAAIDKLFD